MFRVGVWRQCGVSRLKALSELPSIFSVVSRRNDVADEIGTAVQSCAKAGLDLTDAYSRNAAIFSSKVNCRANGTLVNPHFSPPRLLSSNLKRPTAWPCA